MRHLFPQKQPFVPHKRYIKASHLPQLSLSNMATATLFLCHPILFSFFWLTFASVNERLKDYQRPRLRIYQDTTGAIARHCETPPVSTPLTHQAVGTGIRGVPRCATYTVPTFTWRIPFNERGTVIIVTEGNLHIRQRGRGIESRHPHARYRARAILTCLGEHAHHGYFPRGNLAHDDGGNQQGDEWRTQSCHQHLQGRIPQTFPPPTHLQPTRHGQARLPTARLILYRRQGGQHRVGSHHQDAQCHRRPARRGAKRHLFHRELPHHPAADVLASVPA